LRRRRRTPRQARLIVGLITLGAGALAAVALAAPGQPGAVDTTFANHGIASFASGPAANISFIAAQVVQSDGKVVMVGPTKPDQSGDTQMGVVRLNRDGSLDTTFGGGTGAALIGFGTGSSATATAVALQRNGDIVVVGAAFVGTDQIGVSRLTPSGSLDATFNPSGAIPGETTVDTGDTAQTPPETVGVAVQPADQKIVVVGTQDLVSGSAFQVSRLTTGGQLDPTFSGGTVTTQIGGSSSESTAAVVAVQSDGKIVVGGNGTTNTGSRDFQVARYRGDGVLDGSFNGSGTRDIPIGGEDPFVGAVVQAVAIQPSDGKIVLAGGPRGGPQTGFGSVENGHAALVRLNTNGALDPTFSGGGQTGGVDLVPFPGSSADTANALTIDPVTGTLLVAGTAELPVQGQLTGEIIADRLNPDGSLDATFGDPGMTVLGVGGSAAVDLLNTVSNAVDALIGGTVGTSAGAIAITATPPPGTTTTTIPAQCGRPIISKKAHDVVRGDVRAVGRGQRFAYVITVANPGPCVLANLVVADPLPRAFGWVGPAGSSVVFASPTGASPQSLIQSSNSTQALVGAALLPAGDSMTVSLPGRAKTLGRQSDTAAVTASDLTAVASNAVTLEVTTVPRAAGIRMNARGATGTASGGAGGTEAALSQLAHVDIAVRALSSGGHAAARGCVWLNRQGRLVRVRPGKGGKCDSPLWLRANGTRHWRHGFRGRLRSGRYQLLVRVSNRAGVYDTTFAPGHHDVLSVTI
jgi:uncharacterized delta-60 repeat protein/uncharacterized repeat protein (TIGR01451 family)